MKAHLLFQDRDARHDRKSTPFDIALTQDLGLDALFAAMSQEDEFLFEAATKTMFESLTDIAAIHYRQAVLNDCIANEALIRDLYQTSIDAIASERRNSFFFSRSPSSVLSKGNYVLRDFMPHLHHLREIAEAPAGSFTSAAFVTLFATLKRELNHEFFREAAAHLRRLKFDEGVLISAQVGKGNKGVGIMLRTPWPDDRWWPLRLLGPKDGTYTCKLDPRDENGHRALSMLCDQGINSVANALGQSTDHILHFFQMLRSELAFYVGCLNARAVLASKGQAVCFPTPAEFGERRLSFRQLYDVSLALNSNETTVANVLQADGKSLLVVTGANQGGKTTYARSLGQAQLMMQAGMFVPADSFAADAHDRLFTHFKREEDASMTSGKLDEELRRMSAIVDAMTHQSMVIFNESFAATNDREGSEINAQIVGALSDFGIKVVTVTHLYEFARKYYHARLPYAIFLRAERREDGSRTFKIFENEPLQTSFGEDLYDEIFGGRSSKTMTQ